MSTLEELNFGDEIRGVICPNCGGSLVWMDGRAWCVDDGAVKPEPEAVSKFPVFSDADLNWIEEHQDEFS